MKKVKNNKKNFGALGKVVLAIGIAVLFALFVGYAIETIYPAPDWDDFCGDQRELKDINNIDGCIAIGGDWIAGGIKEPIPEGRESVGWCDATAECQEDYDKIEDRYNITLFFITLVIGILTFIIAALLLFDSISSGFMGGGVLIILYGTLRNWESLSNIWRTLMLGLALVVLVWIGYKKFNK